MSQREILVTLFEDGQVVNRDYAWRWGIRNFTARISELEKSGYRLSRAAFRDNQGRSLINYSKFAESAAA